MFQHMDNRAKPGHDDHMLISPDREEQAFAALIICPLDACKGILHY